MSRNRIGPQISKRFNVNQIVYKFMDELRLSVNYLHSKMKNLIPQMFILRKKGNFATQIDGNLDFIST